jgi:hypothetical protein
MLLVVAVRVLIYLVFMALMFALALSDNMGLPFWLILLLGALALVLMVVCFPESVLLPSSLSVSAFLQLLPITVLAGVAWFALITGFRCSGPIRVAERGDDHE